MAEVFVRFTETVRSADGGDYSAQACGGVADDGLWEGWIEFADVGGPPMRTPRETEQPNRARPLVLGRGSVGGVSRGGASSSDRCRDGAAHHSDGHEPSVFAGPLASPVLRSCASTVFSTRSRRTCRVRGFFDNNCRRCRAIIYSR